MSIASRIEAIEQHLTDDYNVLEVAGADLTNVDKNILNLKTTWQERLLYFINNGTDVVWNNWDKVTGEGTILTLNNTEEAPMKINLKGNTSQATAILPSEYTQVDYIQSSGTQYIDTGIKVSNLIRTEIKYKRASGLACLFGSRTDYQRNNYAFWTKADDNKTRDIYGTSVNVWSPSLIDEDKIVVLDKNKNVTTITVDGVTTTHTHNAITFNANYDIYLFGCNNAGNVMSQYIGGTIYYCKMYDNDTLVRDYIPCYRNSDNEVGLYDLVNNVFYANAGTGTFTKGNNTSIPNPDYPQDIHVVSGNNTINVEGKNLFDKNNVDWIKAYLTNGGIMYTPGNGKYCLGTNEYIKVLPNTTYYLSCSYGSGVGHLSNVFMCEYDKDKNNIVRKSHVDNHTFTTESNTQYIRLSWYLFYDANNNMIETNVSSVDTYVTNIQLEYGSTATTYEAYKGASYPINLPIENLINPSLFTINGSYNVASISNGEVTSSSLSGYAGARIDLGQNINLKANDVIYVRLKIKSDMAGDIFNTIQLFNSSNTGLTATETKISIPTITTEYQEIVMKFVLGIDDVLRRLFVQHKGSTSNVFTIKDIQVSYVNGSYTPYGTTPIELCKIGDYQDSIVKDNGKWYLNKQIGKYTFTGNETLATYGGGSSRKIVDLINAYSIANSDTPLGYNELSLMTPRINIFNLSGYGISYNSNEIYVRLADKVGQNLLYLLEGTSLYYILATPTYTEITDSTLLSQLNALAKSYASQTNISQNNNDLPFIINATALKEMA